MRFPTLCDEEVLQETARVTMVDQLAGVSENLKQVKSKQMLSENRNHSLPLRHRTHRRRAATRAQVKERC